MRPLHTDLPAPAGGMNAAARPTGIVLGLVVAVVAVLATTLVPGVWAIWSGFATGVFSSDAVGTDGFSGFVVMLSFALGALWLWLWLRAKERRPFASLGFERRRGRSWLMLAARGLGVGIVMIVVCVLVPVVLGQARLEWANPSGTGVALIAGMLLAFLVQGSTEEILTRGYLTQVVARRWGLVMAVVVQGLFFTLVHGMSAGIGVLPIVNLLLFALFASMYSLAEGGLWGVCAMHGIWNWAQGSLFGVAVSGNTVDSLFAYAPQADASELLTGGTFGIEGSIVTTVVYAVAAFVAWRGFRARRLRAAV